jgi:hypothetical protein
MQQKTLSLLQFQKKFGTEKACQKQDYYLRLCSSLERRRQKVVLQSLFTEFNPDKSPLLWPNCLAGDMIVIAQISMNLSTNQPDLAIFAEILAYLPLRIRIPQCDGP